jgi:rod shape determining protein RodA
MVISRFWKNFDWLILGVTVLLTALGIMVIYAASFKATAIATPFDARNQVIYAILGVGVLIGVAKLDYRTWPKLSLWLYLVMIAMLMLVGAVGKSSLGATRWINIGFFQFQPSELSKIILAIVLAKFFADNYDRMNRLRYLLTSFVVVLPPIVLVLLQPDLGTALVFFFIWLAMVLVSHARKLQLLGMGAVGVAMFPLLLKVMKPYQRHRLQVFLNPTADPLHTGYNVVQAQIAVGSGELFGRGLASGSQSQLNFLPSQYTDFVFAVLAEKLGFIGAVLLLVLFGILIGRGLIAAYRAQDRFGMFLAVGIVAMILFHVVINVGMNMGIMPVTGIPLPFISYGGTSLIVAMIAVGLLESIAVRHKKIEFGV